ncbi:unnamed protein product [Nesidiocoris tenuis]|uniref:Uncharacterized protein n=1 Tax=Nesidiocoris tenuis TaxID=355587 RepID=A0A6H5G7T7_9HEMI|nr:unnamed protein product [Nesidiocoris tenuis]
MGGNYGPIKGLRTFPAEGRSVRKCGKRSDRSCTTRSAQMVMVHTNRSTGSLNTRSPSAKTISTFALTSARIGRRTTTQSFGFICGGSDGSLVNITKPSHSVIRYPLRWKIPLPVGRTTRREGIGRPDETTDNRPSSIFETMIRFVSMTRTRNKVHFFISTWACRGENISTNYWRPEIKNLARRLLFSGSIDKDEYSSIRYTADHPKKASHHCPLGPDSDTISFRTSETLIYVISGLPRLSIFPLMIRHCFAPNRRKPFGELRSIINWNASNSRSPSLDGLPRGLVPGFEYIIVITVAWTEMKRIFIPVTVLVALRNRGIIMEQLPSGVQFSTKDPYDFEFDDEFEFRFHCEFDFEFDDEFELLLHCEVDFEFYHKFRFLFHWEFDFEFD